MTAPEVRVLVPTGMLGAGFSAESIDHGIALGADVIAVDGGSTDSGPAYLATSSAKMPAEAIAADLRLMLTRGAAAGIPVIIGSAGTGGTDAGVDWVAGIVGDIADAEHLRLRVARIYSEQNIDRMRAALAEGKVLPLPPSEPLSRAVLERCDHVVGLMGAEPIIAALEQGVDVVVAGRATDTALIAALPLMRGCPPGPSWHAAKVAECGGMCTTDPRGGGVLVVIDRDGFTIEPLDHNVSCTPRTVAAHMLYENANPFVMREPSGTLDVSGATYTAVDERVVRVTGSRFIDAPYTVKLEGAGPAGYQTLAIAGIRDPEILSAIDEWASSLQAFLDRKVHDLLGLTVDDYHAELRCYGWNAVLGELDPDTTTRPREVGAMLLVTAPSQETATTIVKLANPYLLHMPLAHMTHLPSYAFMASPAEIERGAVYEFELNHVVSVATPDELFRTRIDEIGPP
jgi:hypothetical protein